jgi:pSer/pThr/pTyr-binding forkhead associated (FHA) protein
LKEKIDITIGSDEKNNYQILGKYVNPFHARIYSTDGNFLIEDLNSKFGTYVNNHRITKLTIINQDDRISIGYHKIRLTDLLDDNESKSVDWKDLLIPGRFIEKNSISTLIIVLACYPIIVGFGVPTILTLYNVTVRRTNLKIELDVWGLSPYGYWILGIAGIYILVITTMNFINGLKNTAGNNGEHS